MDCKEYYFFILYFIFLLIFFIKLAAIAYIIACVYSPSIMQAITLCIVLYGTSILPHKILHKILPLLLVYTALYIIAQAIYNIDFNFPQSDTLSNIGFSQFDSYFGYLGIQCIPVFLLAAHWRFCKLHNSFEAKKEDNDNEKQEKDDNKKERKRINIFADRFDKTTVDKIQFYIFESLSFIEYCIDLSWQIFLKNSYYLTLLALLLCSLLDANLFNFGYLCFFVLFLLSRKIAIMFWIVLVLYTESVIMIIFLWQLTWTEHLDDTDTADWFGLQHYDHLISGLVVPIAIFGFSIAQLQLINVFKKSLKEQGLKIHDSSVKAASFSGQKLDVGPKTRILFNTCEYLLDRFSLPVIYMALFTVAMAGSYDLFSL